MTVPQPSPLPPSLPGSDELTAKILQRTRGLQTSCAEELCLPYRQRTWRKPALWGASMLALTGLLGGAAYLAGTPADPDGLTARWPVESAASFERAANPNSAAGIARNSANRTASATAEPAGNALVLTGDEVAQLRESGWSCPDLSSLGFQLSQAQGTVVDGVPTVKLTLNDGGHTVVVYERHPGGASTEGPVNPLTGNAAARDGFQPLGDGKVWLNPGETWQAVLNSGDASYLLVSDLPPTALKPTTAALASAGRSASEATAGQPGDDVPGRMLRGLTRILAME